MHTAIEQAAEGEAAQVTRRTLYWMALAASVPGGLGCVAWGVLLPLATALLAVRFRASI